MIKLGSQVETAPDIKTPRINILLVEDDRVDACLVRKILSDVPGLYYDLTQAGRLNDALRQIKERSWDIILLDLSLPDSFGFPTFMKLHQEVTDIPIVVLTGLDDEMVALQAMEKGAQDYLVKQRVNGSDLVRIMRFAVQRQVLVNKLRALSLTDDLTGLYNRRGFMFLSQQELNVAGRSKDETLFLLFADLDQMKWINDRYGHTEGDRALVDFAKILKETFRSCDIIGRVGGDEFAVMAVDHVQNGPSNIVGRLRENVDTHNATANRPYELVISAGTIHYDPLHPAPIGEVLQRADQLMYLEKHAKKNIKRI